MNFKSIDDLYSFLEKADCKPRTRFEITRDFRALIDASSDADVKNKIKWETYVFDFVLRNGSVKPLQSIPKEDAKSVYEYPSYQEFNEKAYSYLKERASNVKSEHLIAQYNQVLWNSPTRHKHQSQAKRAIDAYLRLLNRLDCKREAESSGWDCLEILRNGFYLSLQTKYKVADYKKLIHSFLFEKKRFHEDLKIYLLKFLLELPQIKAKDFEGCLEIVRQIGTKRSQKKPDYFVTKEVYQTGLAIAQKCNSDVKIWNKRIGDATVRMAESRLDDETKIVPLRFYEEALPYYRAAGQARKLKEIEKKYFELKKKLKLTKIEVPLDEEQGKILNEYFDTKTKNLLKRSSKEIYGYLISGEDIFPKQAWLQELAKKKGNTFLDFVTTTKFDINKNASKQKEGKGALLKSKIFESYHYYIQMSVRPYLYRIFIDGIINNKITFEGLVKFMYENTWLGQELLNTDSGGDTLKYRWVSLMAPSLHEYFLQTESALKSGNPYTTYIMPIDSLTLKFEGVLRDFCGLIGVSTTITGKGNVLREKYIEDMLADKEVKKYFDEEDLLFFNYLFISKEGMNLRNNIAHSYYRPHNYSLHKMHLLICAFLRIGKYRINIQEKS